MTESEWLACADPTPMLTFLRGKTSDRKFRLFTCACCRGVWHRLGWSRRRAVETAERYADRRTGWLGAFLGEALALFGPQDSPPGQPGLSPAYLSVRPWGTTPATDGAAAAAAAAEQTQPHDPSGATGQTAAVRCIFGNPFRPVVFDPRWFTFTVVALAEAIYAERAFDRLPILADALQDAGCEDVDLLAHCRGPGPHVRGCWVVDLVLGKT